MSWSWYAIDPDYIGLKAHGRTEEEALKELERLKKECWTHKRLSDLKRNVGESLELASKYDWHKYKNAQYEFFTLIDIFVEQNIVTLSTVQSNEAKVFEVRRKRRKASWLFARALRRFADLLQPELRCNMGVSKSSGEPSTLVLPTSSLGE